MMVTLLCSFHRHFRFHIQFIANVVKLERFAPVAEIMTKMVKNGDGTPFSRTIKKITLVNGTQVTTGNWAVLRSCLS